MLAPEPSGPPRQTALDALAARVDAQARELADAKKTLADLTARAAEPQAAAEPEHKFQIYGYTDVGIDALWTQGPVGSLLTPANTASFVVGNLDLYFDAQPVPDWRSLVEITLSNAPHGQVTGLGGLAGTFHRTSTFTYDPNAATVNQYVILGSTIIQRAQIDWTHFDFLKVRTGLFLTPFGIWNMDHGTPTLIALELPQALAYNMFPSQQTGVMVSGSHQAGPWEVGYMATISNGRQDLSNFHLSGNPFGYGGRLYANADWGGTTLKLGASGFTDRVTDQEIDLTSLSPIAYTFKTNLAYTEYTGGLDLSLDVGATRIRAEAVVRQLTYDTGQHEAAAPIVVAGAQLPSRIEQSAYVLVAHQLPVLGLEPFLELDSIYGPMGLGDLLLYPSAGLNIHFNPSVQLKNQVGYGMFFDTRSDENHSDGQSVSKNNVESFYSRLVVVF